MNREAVSSSSVTSIGYDSESSTLEVEFSNGSVYQYFDVPEQFHRELMSGGSIGKVLNSIIKGQFRYART